MDKFKQIYIHMFYQEAGILKFDQKKYRQFLDKAYKITKVIQQDKNLSIDVPDQLIQYCLDNSKQIIPTKNIIQLMKNSKHYYNISLKKSFDLILYPFDFQNDLQVNSFHYNCFNIKDQNILDLMLNEFKNKQLNKLFGFCNNYQNVYICAINTNAINSDIIGTIYHELSHYIQQICNIKQITKMPIINNYMKEKINHFGITNNYVQSMFNSKQYHPHFDDLLRNLKQLYLIKYSKSNNIQFFDNVIMKFLKDQNQIKNSDLCKDFLSNNVNDIQSLYFLKTLYICKYKFFNVKQRVLNYIAKDKNDVVFQENFKMAEQKRNIWTKGIYKSPAVPLDKAVGGRRYILQLYPGLNDDIDFLNQPKFDDKSELKWQPIEYYRSFKKSKGWWIFKKYEEFIRFKSLIDGVIEEMKIPHIYRNDILHEYKGHSVKPT